MKGPTETCVLKIFIRVNLRQASLLKKKRKKKTDSSKPCNMNEKPLEAVYQSYRRDIISVKNSTHLIDVYNNWASQYEKVRKVPVLRFYLRMQIPF